MKIEQGKVVTLEYDLSEGDELLETTKGNDPFVYLHGFRGIIPGLERALEGREPGERFSVTIEPAEAYGEWEPGMSQTVARTMFGDLQIELGQQFHAQTNHGMHIVTVTALEGDQVTIDGNHPMSGKTLTFDVVVSEIRDSTEEEKQHGHPHGAGGCDHDHGHDHDHAH